MSTRSLPHLPRRPPTPPGRHESASQPDRRPAVESRWIGVAVAVAAIVIVWAVATAVHNAAEPRPAPATPAAATPTTEQPCTRAAAAAAALIGEGERILAADGEIRAAAILDHAALRRLYTDYQRTMPACRAGRGR